MPYIDELKTEMEEFIRSKQETVKGGGIPAASVGDYVRVGRMDLINLAKAKKETIIPGTKREINEKIVKPFKELDEIDHQIQTLDSEISLYTTAADNYARKAATDVRYTIFNNYYCDEEKRKKKKNNEAETEQSEENLPFHEKILNTAKEASRPIIKKVRKGFVLSVLIGVICAIFDVFMLYGPFSIGNSGGSGYSLFTSIVFAACLDALPTLIGILFTKKTNIKKNIDLKLEFTPNVNSEKKDLTLHNLFFGFLIFLTVCAFIVYFAARLVLIIGGDDFDVGWKLIQGWITHTSLVENPEDIEHDFSAISFITPLLSSAFALIASITVSEPTLNNVDQFCIQMRNTIRDISEQCEHKVNDLNSRKSGLETEKKHKIAAIWSDYGYAQPIPEFTDFIIKVQSAAHRRITETYTETYEIFCRQARSHTEIAINTLTAQLSSYSNTPMDVINMTITEDEQAGLDYIWNINGDQHTQTINHMENFNKYITNILKQWGGTENNNDGINANYDFQDNYTLQ